MKHYDFLAKRKVCGFLSIVLVILSIAYIATIGIKFNVDFEGGTKMTVAFEDPDLSIQTVREAVEKYEPKATIVEEEAEGVSRFSLKIKKPDVEAGNENEASLTRRRNLETAFAGITSGDAELISKLKAVEPGVLASKFQTENIYGLVDKDEVIAQTYRTLAGNVVSNAATAATLKDLAAASDQANADKLETAITNVIFPALNHITTDAFGAALSKYDPLKRGNNGSYKDIAAQMDATRSANHDFIKSFDVLDFSSTVAAGEDAGVLKTFIQDNFVLSTYRIVSNETFSPSIAAELLSNAESAIFMSLLCILIYVAIRFDGNYAVASVVALAHDVVISLGVFAVAGTLWGVELSNPVVAAFLTIVGYSLNDTIVVFDRIRDNRSDMKNPDLVKLTNTSINQTLSRTLVTSLTTFFVVAVIYWGSNNATLEDFAFPLLIGIIVGTYSSIFVASPVFLYMTERKVLQKLGKILGGIYRTVTLANKGEDKSRSKA